MGPFRAGVPPPAPPPPPSPRRRPLPTRGVGLPVPADPGRGGGWLGGSSRRRPSPDLRARRAEPPHRSGEVRERPPSAPVLRPPAAEGRRSAPQRHRPRRREGGGASPV